MEKERYYVYKLVPPRPSFDIDATEDEQAIMGRHAAYWQGLTNQGRVLVFGPVSASSGAWGLAVVAASEEQELHDIAAGDPAITSGTCTYEVGTMPRAITPIDRPGSAQPAQVPSQ